MALLLFAGCSRKTTGLIRPDEDVAIEQIDFDYMQGKSRMVLQDGVKEREVRASVRVRKDSVIWMSFSVVGVHGGRALINQDSITIINNVEKEYFVFEYDELSRQFNFEIDFHVIQAAALGNLIIPRAPGDRIEHHENGDAVLRQTSGTISVDNFINGTTKKIEKVALKELNSNNTLTIDYSNFQPLGNKLFPYNGKIDLLYKTQAGLLNTTIIFEYNKAEVADKELKFPFNIPKRYEGR